MLVLLVTAFELLVAACGLKFPDQGSNLGPLSWERGVPPSHWATEGSPLTGFMTLGDLESDM